MNDDYMLRRFRRLGVVPRWTIIPTLRSQKVDQHSYQVVQIARELLKVHAGGLYANSHDRDALAFEYAVVINALDHDWDEAETGDTPSPAKPVSATALKPNQIKVVVKCADIIEALMFLEEESLMGNQYYVHPIRNELFARLHDWWGLFEHREDQTKPVTSNMLSYFTGAVRTQVHPGMEARDARNAV